MPGDETHGFDMALEIAERGYDELLGTFFQDNDLVCAMADLLNVLPGVDLSCETSLVTVSFERPNDFTLPAGSENPIDIQIGFREESAAGEDLGEFAAGLRIVVEAEVTRESGRESIVINFAEKIHHAKFILGGLEFEKIPPVVGTPLTDTLQDALPAFETLGLEVTDSDDPGQPARLDFRIIDDAGPDDRDASVGLLTFGGGTPGDLTAFQRSFVPEGSLGAMAFSFGWLCRILDPLIRVALGVDEDDESVFRDCRLQTPVEIDEENSVFLTAFELRLADGAIEVSGEMTQSGFCYDASATFSGSLGITPDQEDEGALLVESDVPDPDVEISIPWWCWLLGVVVIVLGGVIGTIVVAIVAVITWIIIEVIEGVLEELGRTLAGALNTLTPDVSIPIALVPVSAFIDDVTIGLRVRALSRAPIRSEGVVQLFDGQAVDLDDGRVGDESLEGADLLWEGSGGRRLRTICRSQLARTGRTDYDGVNRYVLGTFGYASPEAVPEHELAFYSPVPGLFGNYVPYGRVYGVRTDEGRFALVQAIALDDHSVLLRYRTYDKRAQGIRIVGRFRCEPPRKTPRDAEIRFEPSPLWRGDDECDPDDELLLEERIARADPKERRLGRWSARVRSQAVERGRFHALVTGLARPFEVTWAIQGQPLVDAEGRVEVDGVEVGYRVLGTLLVLTPRADAPLELELSASARAKDGPIVTTRRCVRFEPSCEHLKRHIPDFKTYAETYQRVFGSGEQLPDGKPAKLRFGSAADKTKR